MMREIGFSLIELMIVLAIISGLSCLAYPAYSQYWKQVRRLEARLTLLEVSTRLEKYAATHEAGYLGADLNALGIANITERGWYQLSLEDVGETQYTLYARPTFKDIRCSELSCNAQGQRSFKGEGRYNDCWGE